MEGAATKTAEAPSSAFEQEGRQMLGNVAMKKVVQYVKAFRGAPIGGDDTTLSEWSDSEPETVKSIVRKQFYKRMRKEFQVHKDNPNYFLKAYESLMAEREDPSVVIDVARVEKLMPAVICRLILRAKSHITNWTNLNRIMNNPYGMSDQKLAEIVTQCLWNDITDGACAYMRHRTMTEESCSMLKRCCEEPNMPLFLDKDETDEGECDEEEGEYDEEDECPSFNAEEDECNVSNDEDAAAEEDEQDEEEERVEEDEELEEPDKPDVLLDEETTKPPAMPGEPYSGKVEIVRWIESKSRPGKNRKGFVKLEPEGCMKCAGSGMRIYWLGSRLETPRVAKRNRLFLVEDLPQSGELVFIHQTRPKQRRRQPPPANGAKGDNAGGLDMAEYDLILSEGVRLLGL